MGHDGEAEEQQHEPGDCGGPGGLTEDQESEQGSCAGVGQAERGRGADGNRTEPRTVEGVGHRRNPQVWMKAGDVLEVEITGIGTLRTKIVDET